MYLVVFRALSCCDLLLAVPAPPISSAPPPTLQDQTGTQLISGGVMDGRLSCMVRRAINTSDTAQDYPLDQQGFVLFAYGTSPGGWNGYIPMWLGLPHSWEMSLGAYMQYIHMIV